MKRFLLLFEGLVMSVAVSFSAENHIFKNAYDSVKDKKAVFVPGGAWVPYPAYSDRAAWDKLSAPFKEDALKLLSKYKGYEWKPQTASSYLEYALSGEYCFEFLCPGN